MGVNGFHRGGALAGLVAACLALAATASAQSPDPDAAPGPSPDPAPTRTKPAKKPAVEAPTPNQPTAPQTTPTPANESSPDSGAAATPRQTTAKRRTTHRAKHHKPSAVKRVAASSAPALPRIRPAQLLASPSDGDDRARRLAIGAVALLLLALASATLIAVTARVERRRTTR